MVLEDLLPKIKIWRSKVGDVFVAEEIKKRGADFGGEPSGTWIFPKQTMCPDGIFAAAFLATLIKKKKLSQVLASIPKYPILRGSVPFKAERREKILRSLEEEVHSMKALEVAKLDGWRIKFEDGWALIRFSGTEPLLRITAEAREERRAKEIYSSIHSKVAGLVR